MICPHCGRTTREKELCDYCKMPTEFTARSTVRPGVIPGIQDPPFSPPEPKPYQPPFAPPAQRQSAPSQKQGSKLLVYIAVIAVVALSVAVVVCMILLRITLSQLQEVRTAEPTVSVTEPIAPETPTQAYQVILDRNFPIQGSIPDYLLTIDHGEHIPLLPSADGYVFCGWNTSPDGEGTYFRPEDPFMIPLSEDLTLYGQWEAEVPDPEQPEPDPLNSVPEESEDGVMPEETTEEAVPEETTAETVPAETTAETAPPETEAQAVSEDTSAETVPETLDAVPDPVDTEPTEPELTGNVG